MQGEGRARPWILGVLLVVLLAGVLFRIAARTAERRIATRIEGLAGRTGMRIQFSELRVGLLTPFRMRGVVLEKPGLGMARIETVSVSPGFRGERGLGLIGRVWVEGARVILPASMEFRLHPSFWDVDPDRSVTLRSPVEGLSLIREQAPGGGRFDLKATGLQLDRLGAFVIEGTPSRNVGVVDGEAHWQGDGRSDLQARWSFAALSARTIGSLAITPSPSGPQAAVSIEIQKLDFSRALTALGFDPAAPAEPLGSLSGTVRINGRLDDPSTLALVQQFHFTPPAKLPASITRLRSGFTHDVVTDGAGRKIVVSEESPDFIAVSNVPALFIRTLLIAEDAAFFSHPGIDLTELPRAIATNIARGEPSRGGSTITQQLAKNLFLTREKSLERKLTELPLAFLLESALGKQRILEIYLNIIEWGPGLYGLLPASRHYFGKEPWALSAKEICFLVAMIPGPLKYQRSIQGGELRRGFETLVTNLLVKLRSVDAISEEEFQSSLVETLVFRTSPLE